jgi:Toprim-like
MKDPQFQLQVEKARSVPIQVIAEQLDIQTIRSYPRFTQVFCPFHGGDSGVLVHDGRRNLFKCHAGCVPKRHTGRSKSTFDGIDLVIEMRGLSFTEAIAFILGESTADFRPAVRTVRQPKPSPPEKPIAPEEVERLHQRLMLTDEGEQALKYLESRGIQRRTALRWRLGLTSVWEGSLDWLTAKVPGLDLVLERLSQKGLNLRHQHDVFRRLCLNRLDEHQVRWLSKYLDPSQLISIYSHAAHMRSLRLVIPVWENGPPQDGAALCWGMRYRYIPDLTPEPSILPGSTVVKKATRQKYLLLEALSDSSWQVRLKRDQESQPLTAHSDEFSPEITKCWGRGQVRTLAANNRQGKPMVLAVEGEMDLLALDQVLLPTPLHRNCWLISSTNGASNFPLEWRNDNFWKSFVRILFAYDQDKAGQEALQRMREQGVLLESVHVPHGKDFNDWLIYSNGQISARQLQEWVGHYAWYCPLG